MLPSDPLRPFLGLVTGLQSGSALLAAGPDPERPERKSLQALISAGHTIRSTGKTRLKRNMAQVFSNFAEKPQLTLSRRTLG